MNHQYMQQQQQQPGFYAGPHNPPYGGISADPSQNLSKTHPPQKQGPPPPMGNLPPPIQTPYYNNNPQGNTQLPPAGSPHMAPPMMGNQSNLSNQMANMSLANQRPPSANFPPPPPQSGNSNFPPGPHPPPSGNNSNFGPGAPPPLSSNNSNFPPGVQSLPSGNNTNYPPGLPPSSGNNSNYPPGAPPPNVNGFDGRADHSNLDSSSRNEGQQPAGHIGGAPIPGHQPRPPTSQQGLPQPPDNPAYSAPHSTDSASQYSVNNQQYPSHPPPMHAAPPTHQAPPMGFYPSPGGLPPQPRPPMVGGQPPLPGQVNFQGQPRMPRQNIAGPPMPGQPMDHRYGPSMPGQQMGPGRQPLPAAPGYPGAQQQPPYQQDPYAGQRPGGVPYQGGMGQQQQQPARRLDPDQMPSPIQVMQDDARVHGGVFVTNQKGLVPPLVTTKYTTQDEGNSSPRYIRSTMYTVPTTNDMIKQTGVPFGLILSPMAEIGVGEFEPPIVDMGEIGPVRCIRCKAYMSPFMQFIDAGRRFQCMFCKATSEVPQEYFQHLDHTGQRMDRLERPELTLGTYEYTATTEYCRNNAAPKPPAIIFVIDVSYNTVKSGLVNLICAEMKRIIANLPIDAGQTRTSMKVGFVTYNNTVHFYNVNPCLTQPQMMVVGDVQDVFMPLLDGFLCDPEESGAVIDSLMTQIPAMFAETRETETILAPAIQAGLEALKASERPGKLMVFHSSLPIADAPGKLKNRDDRKVLGTEKEKTVLAPQTNVYNNLGQDCVAAGCSVDLFVFNNSYVDIATIGQICRMTGGEVYKYTYFQADVDGERLITDIVNNISRPIAFDAVMRVRTSTGVRPTDFYGHFFMSNTTDMELASIDCNKAVAIEIKHDDKLAEEEGVFIQAALLYTSCGGVRRLRIINLSLRTSPLIAELYRACDLDAVINFFSKQSVFKLIESSPKAVKDGLVTRCATILAAYRKHCASPSSAGQLILPECMKLLPLYVNCLLKSDAISGGADMTIDDRSYVMQAVATMPLYTSVIYFYPRLLPLHDIDPQETHLPQQLRCSFDKFQEDGAYLLENGIHMFLWLGSNLSTDWVVQVFGVAVVDTDRSTLPVLDTSLNKRVRDIITRVRAERHHCMRLTIVRQRDKLEMVIRHFLVEDRGNDSSPSYVDFLCHMHKEIKTLLSQ